MPVPFFHHDDHVIDIVLLRSIQVVGVANRRHGLNAVVQQIDDYLCN